MKPPKTTIVDSTLYGKDEGLFVECPNARAAQQTGFFILRKPHIPLGSRMTLQ